MSTQEPGAPKGQGDGDEATLPQRRPYARTFDKRRREILTSAWAMVAETEGSEFTLQELSERCGVSLRTIYNAFGDKEGVIAAAAAMHHQEVLQTMDFGGEESRTLTEAIEMTRRIAAETATVPGFSLVTAGMYFMPRGHPQLTSLLRQMPASILQSWLRSGEVDRKMVKAFGQEALEASHADSQWGVVAEWCAGQIGAEEIETRMVRNLLLVAAAFGNRAGRSLAKQLMADD